MQGPADGGAEFVGAGAFRVDRGRMLEKLSKHQLRDPSLFLLSWLRCAAASGARRVSVDRLRRPEWGVELRFDGRPFTAPELAEPYACLFGEEEPASRRNRELAYGLVAALRLGKGRVRVASGAGKERVELAALSLREETVGPADLPETVTVVRAAWESPPEELREAEWLPDQPACSRLLEEFPAPLWVDGRERPRSRPSRDAGALAFDEGGLYGRFRRPEGYPPYRSPVALHSLGVLVDTVSMEFPDAQAAGFVNDDGFALDISQSSVVRDKRFMAAMARVGQAARDLLERELKAHAERMPALGKLLLDPVILELWRARLESDDAWGSLRFGALRPVSGWLPEPLLLGASRLLGGAPARDATSVSEDGFRLLWLRDAAERALLSLETEPSEPVQRALSEAPLLFDGRGGPLSLAGVQRLFDAHGSVPIRRSPLKDPEKAASVVWLASERDAEFLSRWFRGKLSPGG